MNKRQAKKRYNKALNPTVCLINPIAVDKKGNVMKRELGNGTLGVPKTVELSNMGFICFQGNRFLTVPRTVDGKK